MARERGRVGVVLPAGGRGRRMGGDPKQFRELGGAPVLIQTARVFAANEAVGPLVVVVPESAVDEATGLFRDHRLPALVVAGGADRQSSVAAGLGALGEDVEIVLVHDAVRPFVTAALVEGVLAAVRTHGAAAAAVPVADTLRRGDGSGFGETVEREGVWAMQTPQGARLDWLRRAHALAGNEAATDEVGVLQRAGYRVALVQGDTRNLKLTRPEDWALAHAIWDRWNTSRTEPR